MQNPNRNALLDTLLEAGVEGLALQELYPGHVELVSQVGSVHNAVVENSGIDNVWQHQNHAQSLAEMTSPELDMAENELVNVLAQQHKISEIAKIERRNSVTFMNPFYEGAPECGGDQNYSLPTIVCEHADTLPESVFNSWSELARNSLAPGHHFNPVAGPHLNSQVIDGVYQEIEQQISRRYSIAHLPGISSFETSVAQATTSMSNIQFIIEDPSIKERSQRTTAAVDGRRHSVGTPHLYCCPWTGCNKVFNRFYNLRSHYRIHSGEKPYTCNYCEAAFARNHDLKRHERIHSKTKPYVCHICNKAFSRNDAMTRHIRLNSCTRLGA